MKFPPIQHIRSIGLRTSAILGGLIVLHLIGVYIYSGGHYIGVPGGSITIGAVGKGPNIMNPLSYGENMYDEAVFRFLFRGLIKYNPEEETAGGDLARCNLTTLEKVTCTLVKEQRWSDGTPIQNRDVIETYLAFETSSPDAEIRNFLKDTSITEKNGEIIFSRKTKDPLMLKILTYPIFRSDTLEQIKTNRISPTNYVTSGQYTITDTGEDAEYKATRISLSANKNTGLKSPWLDKIHFKFFESEADIEKSEDTLGFIIPRAKNEKLTLSARWKEYTYTTYEFFSVFFHTDTLSKDLRGSLHWQIGNAFSGKIDPNHRPRSNIFARSDTILPVRELGNFADILRKSGYVKKDELLANIEKIPTTLTGGFTYDIPKYFQNKQNSTVLFVDDAKGGILLRGKVPKGIESVMINGYTLKEFLVGNQDFSYRVSEEANTLKEGKNTYLLEAKGTDGKSVSEVLTLYYTKDEEKMKSYRQEVDSEYSARANTPAQVAERQRKKDEEKQKVTGLDPQYYYNDSYEPFRLRLAYVTGPQSTETYANVVEDVLKKLSIKTEKKALETKDIESIIKTGKKPYDILIIGIESGDTVSDIGKLFERGSGVNFSNIEMNTLTNLFSELSKATSKEDIERIEGAILDIMREESFFLPLSSPLHRFYIDRNLKGVRSIPTIAGKGDLYDILENVSIKDTYIIELSGKGPIRFFGWIWDKLTFQETTLSGKKQ